jgi:hypothetical protein
MVVAVSQCSRCGSQTREDDAYCQECGKFVGSETTDTNAPKAAPSSAEPHPSEFLTNLSPRSAKPVVSLPVVAAAVALLLFIPCGIYAIEHSYESISKGYICDQARRAIEAGTPATAIELLKRLALTHHGLTGDESNILDRALAKESDQLIVAGNYQRARDDLQQIKGTLAQSEEVHQRLQVCDRNSAQQIAESAKAPKVADAHAVRRMLKPSTLTIGERARRSLATAGSARAAASTVAKRASALTTATTPVSTAANSATSAPPSPDGPPPEAKVATTTSATATSDPAPVLAGSTSVQAADKTKRSKTANFSHNDVARYNALLAGYFSSRGGGEGELREPLSFREWVEKGKPKF